jgi:dihydrofolate reductase
MTLNLIYARASNGVIGNHNTLPWHLPEDLAHFKQLTHGCPVIMGRKTWDSLPPRFRPLPGRTNIVVTRQSDWQGDGALRAGSLTEAVSLCDIAQKVWVIGGSQIYAAALPLADRLEVTEIERSFEGDAYAPTLGDAWVEAERSRHVSTGGLPFSFVSYVRAPNAHGSIDAMTPSVAG